MPGTAGPADDLAAALDRQTKTLMEVLKGNKTQPSVVKVTPTLSGRSLEMMARARRRWRSPMR
eukprot:5743449-Alexandrium_andersonii.AAC.1